LFVALAAAPDAETAKAIRDELIELHLPLAEHCARRFSQRGEPVEDLIQVGTIGLIKAVDRFDLDREVEFSTYATPTIIGEIKRHFRDKGWTIRVPRRLQELRMSTATATGELPGRWVAPPRRARSPSGSTSRSRTSWKASSPRTRTRPSRWTRARAVTIPCPGWTRSGRRTRRWRTSRSGSRYDR
jgi:RNA polymerase sigma factor (sigma-70 family)